MKRTIYNLTIAFLLLHTPLSAQHWQVIEMAPMPERVSNSAIAAGSFNWTDYVYSFAGIDSTKNYSGIHLRSFRYNVQADIWESIPPLPDDMGKIAASADRVGHVIYIIGGYHVFSNQSEISSEKVHRYDIATNTYLSDGAPIPVPIDDQVQAVWRDSLIYVITGWSNNGNVPNVQIYDPATDNWMVGTPTPNTHSYKSFGSTGVIHGDTIYYFGGARSSGNFGVQKDFRKGLINPNDPTDIEWSITTLASDINGYRMAATMSKGQVFWLGGSANTYNFDGIAYNGAGGVPPLNRSLLYNPSDGSYEIDNSNTLPMDLRGLGNINDTLKFMVGGMMADQWVSNRTFRLERLGGPIVGTKELKKQDLISLYPNPVKEVLYLKSKEIEMIGTGFHVYNLYGQLIREGVYQENGIPTASLPKGAYLLELSVNDRLVSQKFLKI